MFSTMKISHRGTSYSGPEYEHVGDAEAYAISKLERYPTVLARVEVFDEDTMSMVLSVTNSSIVDYMPMYTTHYPNLASMS